MAHLTLAGVSDDGKRLLLISDAGAEFTLGIDGSLRAALRGDASRLGQLEIKMESTLRPRDIQARIRAGESPEAVAQAAQTSVDKIMVYAGPVLAERQHIAGRAQRSSLRRSAGEAPGGARTLGDAVEAHLHSLNIDPSIVEWDAWRREDGRWALRAAYATATRTGTAELTYDAPGNFVLLDNEDSRWLVGEAVVTPDAPRDDLHKVRNRRLSSVPADELPLGDDALELVSETPVEAFLDDSPASADTTLGEEAADAAAADQQAPDDVVEDATPSDAAPDSDSEGASDGASDSDPAADEPPSRRPAPKKRGRASVPSWDEIMFGGSDQ